MLIELAFPSHGCILHRGIKDDYFLQEQTDPSVYGRCRLKAVVRPPSTCSVGSTAPIPSMKSMPLQRSVGYPPSLSSSTTMTMKIKTWTAHKVRPKQQQPQQQRQAQVNGTRTKRPCLRPQATMEESVYGKSSTRTFMARCTSSACIWVIHSSAY